MAVSTFRFELFGGKRGLVVNSRNLCKGPKQRATIRMKGQNGRVHDSRPLVHNDCPKKERKKSR